MFTLIILSGARFIVSYGCLVILLVFRRKPITPQMAACMQAQRPYSHSWRLQSERRESSSLMAIPHECRLYKHVGPDGIPYALVVAHDMFNLQELLEKISAILDYVNSMLPNVECRWSYRITSSI